MKCTIISEASFSERLFIFKKPILSYFNCDKYAISILTLPYTITQFNSLTKKKLKKLVKKVIKLLKEQNIELLYLPWWCKNSLKPLIELEFKICDGKDLFISLASEAIRILLKDKPEPEELEIGVYVNEYRIATLKSLINISKNLKYITLFSDNKNIIKSYYDNIYAQTGLSARISSDFKKEIIKCNIVILYDPPPLKVIAEKQTVMDFSESMDNFCINTLIFPCPNDILPIKHLFDACDQNFASFISSAYIKNSYNDIKQKPIKIGYMKK